MGCQIGSACVYSFFSKSLIPNEVEKNKLMLIFHNFSFHPWETVAWNQGLRSFAATFI